jgi:hypothetical protein
MLCTIHAKDVWGRGFRHVSGFRTYFGVMRNPSRALFVLFLRIATNDVLQRGAFRSILHWLR